jgi:hypothetical protein
MHRDHHGSLDLIDAHLPERVLGNVYRVLEPLGNTFKGSLCLRWLGNIWKCRTTNACHLAAEFPDPVQRHLLPQSWLDRGFWESS